MCGIVGVLGNITKEDKLIFSQMLKFDTDRGPHSTGVFGVLKNDTVVVSKEVGTPWEFFRKSHLTNLKGEFTSDYKIMVGHNRWATVGEVNKENAHPFDTGNVVGVHNGTIEGWDSLKWLEDNGGKHAVDSQMLVSSIGKKGLKESINNIRGAWSLVYYEKDKKTINFLRNKERPMNYAWSEDGKTMYFASEEWIIKFATALYGKKIQKMYSTEEDTHFFALNHGDFDKGGIKFKYYKDKILPKEKPTVVVSYGAVVGSYNSQRDRIFKACTDVDGFCAFSGGKEVEIHSDWQIFGKIKAPTLIGNNDIHIWVDKRKYDIGEVLKFIQSHDGYFLGLPKSISSLGPQDSQCYVLLDWDESIIPCSWTEINDVKVKPENKASIEYVVIKGNTTVTVEDFNKAMKEGCAFCGDNSSTHLNAKDIHWVEYPTQYLCPSCTTHNNHQYI